MAPKPRKPLKHKDATVVSVSATQDTSGKDDLQSTTRTSGVQKRRVAKKKQTSEVDLHETPVVDSDTTEAKVARLTKPTASCSPKTNRKSTREKLKNGKSEGSKNSGADNVPTETKRLKRQSKTQAKTRISQHFEDAPRSDDGSALKKEIKIWGEITGTQKRESGTTGRRKGGKEKVEAEENKKQEGKMSSEGNETEEVTSETKVKKGKGKCGVGGKPTNPQKERHMKKEEDAALEAEMCVQEPAKGNKYIGAHTSIAGRV